MNTEEFARLHAQCVGALRWYVQEANRMCELLSHCQPDALTLEQRSEIHTQRLMENDVHTRYQNIRSRLLEAAKIGYESST